MQGFPSPAVPRRQGGGLDLARYDTSNMSSQFLGSLKDPWFTGAVALFGLVAGLFLWILAAVTSRSHITGFGWSLSASGALIIPFGIGPAVVAAGWHAVILRMRAHPRWLQLGLGSGLVGLALVAASLLPLIVLGPSGRDVAATLSLFFGFLLYGWLLAGAVIAALIPAPDPPRRGAPIWSIAAILPLPVTLIAGCEAAAGILPA
jgi:hypothetical protein